MTLLTVIGTLSAPDYALFVSHNHPDGQVRENHGGAYGDRLLKLLKLGTV